MNYSPETMQYLLQRFGSLKENPTFEEAYQRMSRFADDTENPTREDLLQYADDLETTSKIIRSVIQDCDEVDAQMKEQRYLDGLPESVKQGMEEVGRIVQKHLEVHFLNKPITRRLLPEIRNCVENVLKEAERQYTQFTEYDMTFLRRRTFERLMLDQYSFLELENNPNHPIFGRL